MKEEERELLYRELCARKPFGVIASTIKDVDTSVDLGHGNYKQAKFTGRVSCISYPTISISDETLEESGDSHIDNISDETLEESGDSHIDNVRLYLRSISSLTAEEEKERRELGIWIKLISKDKVIFKGIELESDFMKALNWIYQHHLDINGLIEKGLAYEAECINYEKTEQRIKEVH